MYSVRCAPADQRTLLSLLAAQPTVRFAEPLAFAHAADTTPNDPDFSAGKMWGLNGTNGINATQAWDIGRGSTKVTVAVLDSGTDYQHPDLYRNIWVNQGEIPATIRSQLTDVDSDGLITFWDLNNAVNQGAGKITDLNLERLHRRRRHPPTLCTGWKRGVGGR